MLWPWSVGFIKKIKYHVAGRDSGGWEQIEINSILMDHRYLLHFLSPPTNSKSTSRPDDIMHKNAFRPDPFEADKKLFTIIAAEEKYWNDKWPWSTIKNECTTRKKQPQSRPDTRVWNIFFVASSAATSAAAAQISQSSCWCLLVFRQEKYIGIYFPPWGPVLPVRRSRSVKRAKASTTARQAARQAMIDDSIKRANNTKSKH